MHRHASLFLSSLVPSSLLHALQRVGTRPYMAPELLGNAPPSTDTLDRADCWSLGVIAFQLLVGELPWAHEVPACLHEMVREQPVPLEALRRVGASPAAVQFILAALDKDPARRPSVAELRAHEWLEQQMWDQYAA